MDKQELSYTHTLLFLVKTTIEDEHCDGRGLEQLIGETRYSEVSIEPHHMHASKKGHKEAILKLRRDINDAIKEIDGNSYDIQKNIDEIDERLEQGEIEGELPQ